MSTGRELLEAAAKAAGIPIGGWDTTDSAFYWFDRPGGCLWNPLEDDGDALRLAVKLRLEVDIHHTGIAVRTPDGAKVLVSAEDESNPYAATRRAIVRAAAAMGGLS